MTNYFGYPYQPQPSMSIDKVSNIEEAKKYQIYPGATIYLLDQNDPYIYRKTADAQGKTALRAFSLVEADVGKLSEGKYITRQDFEAFKKELISSINGIKGGNGNGKSFAGSNERNR